MKKIVGIIAALALAGSVFADPELTLVPASFKGDATLEWIANLDNETTGMKNSESSEFKIVFYPDTEKSTEHDQELWGELKIKAGKDEVAAPASGINLNTPSIETAKIHFSDDDFYVRVNIKAPGLSVGGGKVVLATRSDIGTADNPSASVTVTGAQGFTVEFGLQDVVDFNLQFADNGQQKSSAKEFGVVFDATLKGAGIDVEGLELYAGVGFATEKVGGKSQDVALAAKASYKLGIDDKFYVRPSAGFAMKGDAKNVTAAVLFGWGGENADADFAGFSVEGGKQIPNKESDGVSFALTTNLESKDKGGKMGFIFGVFDSTFVPGLKVGADFQGDFNTISDKWQFDAAAKYSNTFDIWTLDANFGVRAVKGAETKTGFLYGFGISTDNSIIQNTKLYAKYSGEHAADLGATVGADLKGTVTLGTTIHF